MKDKPSPPKIPVLFFRWFCHPELLKYIEGDLIELFDENVKREGLKKAKWLFAWDVLKLFRPSIIRPVGGTLRLNHFGLFKNHMKITFRYLQKHKSLTFINLVGLTIGLLVCFFALIYVDFELSYDAYNEKADNIYRLVTDVKTASGTKLQSSSIPMAPAMAESFPEITGFTQVFLDYMIVQSSLDNYTREDVAYTDASLFSLFTLPLLTGNPNKVFDTPYSVVLSESAAIKYFGSTNCIGEQIILDGSTSVYVTGVMKDMPQNSHFRIDILLSMSLLTDVWNPSIKKNWTLFGCYTYLLLEEYPDLTSLHAKLTDFVSNRIDQSESRYEMSLEPLKSIYLHADPRGWRTGSSVAGNIKNIYILAIIAIFVLFIAGFNFVNLSTALSLNRVKEISIRKVLGVEKRHLVFQFLWDALLFSFVAYGFAAILFVLISPYFQILVGKQISVDIIDHAHHFGWLLVLTLFLGIFSGIYPAYFLSGFNAINGIKGKFVSGGLHGFNMGKVLVVTQFFISIVLISSTIVVYQQIQFMLNKDLGYDRKQKLILDFYFDRNIKENGKFVKQQLMAIPGVEQISMSSCVPGQTNRRFNTKIQGAGGETQNFQADVYWVDFDFLDQYRIEVVAGRAFQKDLQSDIKNAMIMNETAARELGYSNLNEVIGKEFEQWNRWRGTVVGVVKDFHIYSLKEIIQPLTIQIDPVRFTFITLDISSHNINETIAILKEEWMKLGPKRPFSYYFADQAYQAQYNTEDRFGKLILYLASIAVLLSCLGLLGLSSLSTASRTKEMGIRKILGATPVALLGLLTKDFLRLVIIASIIAIPVSIFGLNNWLENFAYRIDLHWILFVVATFVALGVSLMTIGSQVIKVSFSNPVKCLGDE